MIYEEICTYEVCKLAKDKGFYGPTAKNYRHKNGTTCNAPSQSQLQRWLREKKNIHIKISVSVNDKHCFYWILYSKGRDCWEEVGMCYDEYDSYELALEDALKYTLQNLL